ncbi:YIP1 family protein [Halosimplex sp. J119]
MTRTVQRADTMGLSTLVTDPRTFFERRQGDPSLVGPALVVAAHALLVIAPTVLLLRTFGHLLTEIDLGTLVYATASERVSAPGSFVLVLWVNGVAYFAIWLAVAAVIYLVSLVFDGEGPFRRVLAFVGWALAPTLIPAAASAVAMTAIFLDAPAFASEAALSQWVRSSVVDHPARVGVDFVRPLFSLWVVYLWTLAAEYGRDLTQRQALLCIALPGVIAVLNAIGTYVGFLAQMFGLV